MDNKIYGANRGPGVTHKPFGEGIVWGQRGQIWQSEDLSPNVGSHGNPSPDPGIPVSLIDEEHRMGVAIQMCTIMAIDPETKHTVPCNGGEDIEVTYSDLDVQYGVLDKTLTRRVRKGETRTYKANIPQGVALQDVLQNPLCHNGHKVAINQGNPDYRKAGQIRFALIYKTDDSKYNVKPGDYLKGDGKPDTTENPLAFWGLPCKWDKDKDDLTQRALRVTYVESHEEFDKQGADIYGANTHGAYVHGGGTMGFPMELYNMMGKEDIINDKEYKKIIVTASILKG